MNIIRNTEVGLLLEKNEGKPFCCRPLASGKRRDLGEPFFVAFIQL